MLILSLVRFFNAAKKKVEWPQKNIAEDKKKRERLQMEQLTMTFINMLD